MSVYEASVQQAFTANHALPLPAGGMEDPHKHTWLMTATFRARRLDETMAVAIDFVRVAEVLTALARDFESCDLNDRPEFIDGRPSAERVAEMVAGRLADELAAELTDPSGQGPWLHGVEVTEAPGCSAAFYPNE